MSAQALENFNKAQDTLDQAWKSLAQLRKECDDKYREYAAAVVREQGLFILDADDAILIDISPDILRDPSFNPDKLKRASFGADIITKEGTLVIPKVKKNDAKNFSRNDAYLVLTDGTKVDKATQAIELYLSEVTDEDLQKLKEDGFKDKRGLALPVCILMKTEKN